VGEVPGSIRLTIEDIFKKVAFVTKERQPFDLLPMNLKFKIKVQKATERFENYQRFSSYLGYN
jgi:hypothetical protein